MSSNPFTVDLKGLKTRPKAEGAAIEKAADVAGDAHGFTTREPGRRGRLPSPRTGQIHAKTLPGVADEIANEARARGTTQGVIIEEAWAVWKELRGR
ncbi:chromosome partitioning protein ParB [Oleomonas cavernae]|uniref:Chromosome partitioning protein ParB n=1 Tax=Oleomonas cavernae TaxID=2320859 RepID=A0A418WCD2_9PROT|nr:chromosome partitioning protein ParB [Oleomonas cavernae]